MTQLLEQIKYRLDPKKGQPVEVIHQDKVIRLSWCYSDVLYSFLGIYTLGVHCVCHVGKKETSDSQLFATKEEEDDYIYYVTNGKRYRQRLYSHNYMLSNFRNYHELNELAEMTRFIDNYESFGNLINVWPGCNTHKGQFNCLDIPEVYFNNKKIKPVSHLFYKEMTDGLDLSFLDEDNKYCSMVMDDFFNMTKEEYIEFLTYINTQIESRTEHYSSI